MFEMTDENQSMGLRAWGRGHRAWSKGLRACGKAKYHTILHLFAFSVNKPICKRNKKQTHYRT